MHESREAFIDLVLRSMKREGREKDLARGELMDRLTHAHHAADEDTLLKTSERLTANQGSRAAWLRLLLGLGCIALLVLALIPPLWRQLGDCRRIFAPYERHLKFLGSETSVEDRLSASFEMNQRRFFLRNDQSVSLDNRRPWILEAWQRNANADANENANVGPDLPTLEERVLADFEFDKRVADDCLALAQRLDPNNGMWQVLASASEWSVGAKAGQPVPESARKMAEAPELRTRMSELTARRIALIPPAQDLRSFHDRLEFFSRQESNLFFENQVQRLLSKCNLEARTKNQERWQEAAECLERLWLRPEIKGDAMTPDQLNWIRMLSYAAKLVIRQAKGFGRADLETRFTASSQAVIRATKRIEAGQDGSLADDGGVWNGSAEMGGLLKGFTREDLKPGRMAEHALVDGAAALIAAALFVILAAFAGLEAIRRPAGVNALAGGLAPLWTVRDWIWLLGLGIALPLAWHLAITRWTPLSFRDLSSYGFTVPAVLLQAAGSFIFAVIMLVQTARWRWARRGDFLALVSGRFWPGDTLAVVALLFVPAVGWMQYIGSYPENYVKAIAATAGLPLLWLFWRAGALLFAPRAISLAGVLVCRRLYPAFLLAAFLLLGYGAFFKWQERRWVAADTWARPDPSGHFATRFNAAVAGEMIQRLKDENAHAKTPRAPRF